MLLKRRDWQFVAIICAVLLVLLFNIFRDKPPPTPADTLHQPFLQALAQGERRDEVEQRCPDCHNRQQRPLPAQHPPKEQCLICHPAQE